ncbi:MAG: Eco47II family restriction endonuclease [Porticoccaceae bacterium]|nr:Eco47II family restriction endonuclease [Porticoccaceae bacterium]
MSYLTYISDETLKTLVKNVLNIGRTRKAEAEQSFAKNVIDPFAALFESVAFEVDHKTWKESEIIRQCQKTLQNHIGDLHQKILGSVAGWEDKGKGSVVDLVCQKKKIIAEVKNKYNTVSGGKLADQYYSLERLVEPKNSVYKGFTAYFVAIIPKKPDRYDELFQPSDKDKGKRCQQNEAIREIDGASFYSLVTGEENALENLYRVLPAVIEKIFKEEGKANYRLADKSSFYAYFDTAYKK